MSGGRRSRYERTSRHHPRLGHPPTGGSATRTAGSPDHRRRPQYGRRRPGGDAARHGLQPPVVDRRHRAGRGSRRPRGNGGLGDSGARGCDRAGGHGSDRGSRLRSVAADHAGPGPGRVPPRLRPARRARCRGRRRRPPLSRGPMAGAGSGDRRGGWWRGRGTVAFRRPRHPARRTGHRSRQEPGRDCCWLWPALPQRWPGAWSPSVCWCSRRPAAAALRRWSVTAGSSRCWPPSARCRTGWCG